METDDFNCHTKQAILNVKQIRQFLAYLRFLTYLNAENSNHMAETNDSKQKDISNHTTKRLILNILTNQTILLV